MINICAGCKQPLDLGSCIWVTVAGRCSHYHQECNPDPLLVGDNKQNLRLPKVCPYCECDEYEDHQPPWATPFGMGEPVPILYVRGSQDPTDPCNTTRFFKCGIRAQGEQYSEPRIKCFKRLQKENVRLREALRIALEGSAHVSTEILENPENAEKIARKAKAKYDAQIEGFAVVEDKEYRDLVKEVRRSAEVVDGMKKFLKVVADNAENMTDFKPQLLEQIAKWEKA